jgi:hypothetical protein
MISHHYPYPALNVSHNPRRLMAVYVMAEVFANMLRNGAYEHAMRTIEGVPTGAALVDVRVLNQYGTMTPGGPTAHLILAFIYEYHAWEEVHPNGRIPNFSEYEAPDDSGPFSHMPPASRDEVLAAEPPPDPLSESDDPFIASLFNTSFPFFNMLRDKQGDAQDGKKQS